MHRPKFMLAMVLVCASTSSMAQITYDVNVVGPPNPSYGTYAVEPEQIVGTITVAPNSMGPLAANDVLGYTFSSVPGDPISLSLSGNASDVQCLETCGVAASATALTSYETPPVGSNVLSEGMVFSNQNVNFSDPAYVFYMQFISNTGSIQGVSFPSPGFDIATENTGPAFPYGWSLPIGSTIGTTSTVPLPAAVWLLLSGLGGLGVFARKRRAA